MNINVQISLGSDEHSSDLSGNATELAQSILDAVGGNPDKDIVSVVINDLGTAGMIPVPPPVPVLEPPAPSKK